MSNTVNANTTADQAFFVKMILTSWNGRNASANKLFAELTDEQLQLETAPGKNTGTYLLGHLTAVADDLFRLLDLGEKVYPDLYETFIAKPDKSGLPKPPVAELRKYWKAVNEKLLEKMNGLQTADWFTRHMAVSEEDFAKEPHRNKLNIIISRTNHLDYHMGQIALLKGR
jgi:hypothetical protein